MGFVRPSRITDGMAERYAGVEPVLALNDPIKNMVKGCLSLYWRGVSFCQANSVSMDRADSFLVLFTG